MRAKIRDQTRKIEKRNEVNLRKKYQLYAESSDAETNQRNNTLNAYDSSGTHNRNYQELSLPALRKSNQPDSAKLYDLSVTRHRRSSSDTSKDKKPGVNVHVKGKRKAPDPPKTKVNPRTLSPKSSLGRKKRPAPLPPNLNSDKVDASSTSLLEDKEIKALIEGSSLPLGQHFFLTSTSSIPVDMERKAYVYPYLKIREDRELTDEQKRTLIKQVSTDTRKKYDVEALSETPTAATGSSTSDIFTFERGQLVYQGNESPKMSSKKDKPLKAPSSPFSPRPWFKRKLSNGQNDQNHSILGTLEKKKTRNDKKDLSELSFSRNSFFGSASRFNIFSRMNDDSNKKERDLEKRRSQIGMPNISELDREAAEIIQKSHDMKKSLEAFNHREPLLPRAQINQLKDSDEGKDRLRSAKDLISNFEANSSNVNRIILNTSHTGTREFSSAEPEDVKLNIIDNKEFLALKSKLPQRIKENNGMRRTNDLMSLWMCPYCTFENPNWKIICEECEKIKPYEKRFCVNNNDISTKTDSPNDSRIEGHVWEKKTVVKYFNPLGENCLSKSASETVVATSLEQKSSSPIRIAGSPQIYVRKNLLKSSTEQQIDPSEAEVNQNNVIAPTVRTFYPSIFDAKNTEDNRSLDKTTPNFNEVRSARLTKFNFFQNLRENRLHDESSNEINKNLRIPENIFPKKLDFSDPIALEFEKERLREKIRAMNEKVLIEKYSVVNDLPEFEKNEKPPILTPVSPIITDLPKLGAIKKTLKATFENRRGSDEKILNKMREDNGGSEKVPISFPTKVEKTKKYSEQREKDEGILKSENGIETFRATLRQESTNMTNTLAMNKILRNLENAIVGGKFDEAAQLATNLAKMKVSLSVTRQKDRRKSEIDLNIKQ